MWKQIGSITRYLGDVPPEVRILKLTEEVGEVAQALIGMNGWNPRKGRHATQADLLDELADVMITAGVAMATFTADAGDVFQRRLDAVMARAGLAAAPSDDAGTGGRLAMVTSNAAKAATAHDHLAVFGIDVEHVPINLEEIQAAAVEDVAAHKAKQAYAVLGRPVIAEDGGFFIDELGDGTFPGSLAKPVTSALGVDGMIALAGLTRDRAAHFRSAVAYASHDGVEVFASDGPTGRIADKPATNTRDGAWSVLWDIWIPPGASKPVSAFSDEEYADYLDAWRNRSVFTKLGQWLGSAT